MAKKSKQKKEVASDVAEKSHWELVHSRLAALEIGGEIVDVAVTRHASRDAKIEISAADCAFALCDLFARDCEIKKTNKSQELDAACLILSAVISK